MRGTIWPLLASASGEDEGAPFDGIAISLRASLRRRPNLTRYRRGAAPFASSIRAWSSAAGNSACDWPGERLGQYPGRHRSLDGEAKPAPIATQSAPMANPPVSASDRPGSGKHLSRRFGTRCHYRVRPWSRMVEVHWGDWARPTSPRRPGGNLRGHCRPLSSATAWSRCCQPAGSAGPSARSRRLSKMRGALTTTRRLRRVTAGTWRLPAMLPAPPTPSPERASRCRFARRCCWRKPSRQTICHL